MSAAHTPGPWEARPAADGSGDIGIVALSTLRPEGYVVIAEVFAARLTEIERSAHAEHDARLFLAAPDLLAALVVAREFISTDRNALADASTNHDGTMEPDDEEAVADYDAALLQVDAAIAKATAAAGPGGQ